MGRHNQGSITVLDRHVDPLPDHAIHAARIVDFDADGRPLIEVDGCQLAARTTVALDRTHVEREVVYAYLDGDRSRPVITGLIDEPIPARGRKLKIRAEDIDLAAANELTLTCGKASITLQRDGKVVIKGVQITSHASGVQRIRGGTIELN